jgi:hypothetical protein
MKTWIKISLLAVLTAAVARAEADKVAAEYATAIEETFTAIKEK